MPKEKLGVVLQTPRYINRSTSKPWITHRLRSSFKPLPVSLNMYKFLVSNNLVFKKVHFLFLFLFFKNVFSEPVGVGHFGHFGFW